MSKKSIVAALCCCLLLCGTAWAQTPETVTYTYNDFPLVVLPDESDTISFVNVFVPRALDITKVTVGVQVNFEQVGDLKVDVYSPSGTQVRLLDEDCGELDNVDTSFDDAAESKYEDFCPVEAGRGPFRPHEELSDFNEENSFGIWSLAVENDQSSRSGWITGFSVTFTGTSTISPTFNRNTVRNAAGLNHEASIAAGELTSIIGYALGPAAAVTAEAGNLPLTLGGTTVTINGAMVPIAYASTFRVTVQAPPDLAGASADIQVSFDGHTSPAVPLDVFFARPGLFTVQPAGTGQVKAANQNGTLNSKTDPAAKGSVITVWASGLGDVDPPVGAGEPAPLDVLSWTTADVTAAIGGVPCTVTFSGLAPGLRGVYQVNILVDPAVTSGTRELVISVANSTSQANVFVEIQ